MDRATWRRKDQESNRLQKRHIPLIKDSDPREGDVGASTVSHYLESAHIQCNSVEARDAGQFPAAVHKELWLRSEQITSLSHSKDKCTFFIPGTSEDHRLHLGQEHHTTEDHKTILRRFKGAKEASSAFNEGNTWQPR